jgi:hypothetical protein
MKHPRTGSLVLRNLALFMTYVVFLQSSGPIAWTQGSLPQIDDLNPNPNAMNLIGGIVSAQVRVRVGNQPTPGADVTFELPENGVFLPTDGVVPDSESRTASVPTDEDGIATTPPICPIVAGDFPITVRARANGQSRVATIKQANEVPQFEQLKLKVLQGQNATGYIRQQKATEPVVQVNDEYGKPVACALVTFRAPTAGPGGEFKSGNFLKVRTDAHGMARGWGFRPNAKAGPFAIDVNASLAGRDAGAQRIDQQNRISSHMITIVEGGDAVNSIGRTASAKVRVTDALSGLPVPGAAVTFSLPAHSFFLDGSRRLATADAVTNETGEAQPPPICPTEVGPFPISVVATFDGEPWQATIGQSNRGQGFKILSIRAQPGGEAVNNSKQQTDPKQLNAAEPAVRVADENGRPVACATVTFSVPEKKDGQFADGGTKFDTGTDARGGAVAAGFRPGDKSGKFDIDVNADLLGVHALQLKLPWGKGSHTGLIVGLIIAGAGGGAAAALAGKKGASTTTAVTPTPTTSTVVITPGNGTVGHP